MLYGKEIGRRVTCNNTSGYSFLTFFVGLSFEGEHDWRERTDRGVLFREGDVNLYRCCEDGELKYGGVISICIARTDDGFRNGELVFIGVYGEGGCGSGAHEGALDSLGSSEISSSSE